MATDLPATQTILEGTMVQFKRNLLSVALASAVLMMSAHASAQSTQTEEEAEAEADARKKAEEAKDLERVVVTGIRGAIERAIDIKQEASNIVEAVTAEDIGKLPDMSIADSLARLPGLTAQRVRGRATDINIRGLSGDFHTTTLNGRQQVSMGVNRGVEFDQYPSELLQQVVVAKTPKASMIGQGLTGTIDLQTIRPLDRRERVVAMNLRGDRNRLEDSKLDGVRGSISYIDQNEAGTMGIAMGYAYQDSPGQSNSWRAWGYEPNGLISGSTIQSRITDSVREGFNTTLEYRPSDDHRGAFDVYYSRFDVSTRQRGIEIGLGCCGGYLGGTLVSYDPATRASSWSGSTPVFRTDVYANEDQLLSFGWNHEWRFSDAWTATFDVSRSTAKREGSNFESNAGFALGTSTTLDIAFNPGGWYDMNYGRQFNDPSALLLRDIGGWGGDGFDKPYSTDDSLNQVRLEMERTFETSWVSSLSFGLDYTSREKERFATENRLCINSCSLSNQTAPYPTGGNYAFGFFGIPFLPTFNPSSVTYDSLSRDGDFGGARKSFGVEEKLTTAYVQLNLNGDLGSVPVRGNIGLQVVHADQTGFGRITYAGNNIGDPFSDGASYTEVLPSMNLIFQFPYQQVLRTGLARQAARPRMDDMSAGFGYGVNLTAPGGPRFEAGGGNPTLRPWIANAFDASYEKYFGGGKGYVAAAFFFKDLKNYIARQPVAYDFTGLPIPDDVTQLPASNIGIYTRPVNGEGGFMAGWELSASIPLEMFWQPLEGFGIQASYTDTRTSIDPSLLGFSSIPGFSRYTSNLTLYWERFGWGVRATQRTRSTYVGEGINVFLDPEYPTILSEKIVDFQLSYTVQSGRFKNLGFLFQAANLTDEPFKSSFNNDSNRPERFEDYGNNVLLGISYKF
jgi:iron complex outermembrane receptor protein